jgi:hypothetical protein
MTLWEVADVRSSNILPKTKEWETLKHHISTTLQTGASEIGRPDKAPLPVFFIMQQ